MAQEGVFSHPLYSLPLLKLSKADLESALGITVIAASKCLLCQKGMLRRELTTNVKYLWKSTMHQIGFYPIQFVTAEASAGSKASIKMKAA